MTEDTFEIAACPEDGYGPSDVVTDEEFNEWVKRSQAKTARVMKDWDSEAKPRDRDEDWDGIEFYQDDFGPATEAEPNEAMRRAVRRRHARRSSVYPSRMASVNQQLAQHPIPVPQPFADEVEVQPYMEMRQQFLQEYNGRIYYHEVPADRDCAHEHVTMQLHQYVSSSMNEIKLRCRTCGYEFMRCMVDHLEVTHGP